VEQNGAERVDVTRRGRCPGGQHFRRQVRRGEVAYAGTVEVGEQRPAKRDRRDPGLTVVADQDELRNQEPVDHRLAAVLDRQRRGERGGELFRDQQRVVDRDRKLFLDDPAEHLVERLSRLVVPRQVERPPLAAAHRVADDVGGAEAGHDLVDVRRLGGEERTVEARIVEAPQPDDPLEAGTLHLPGAPQRPEAVLRPLLEEKEAAERRVSGRHHWPSRGALER
jgi:hypothetical protein